MSSTKIIFILLLSYQILFGQEDFTILYTAVNINSGLYNNLSQNQFVKTWEYQITKQGAKWLRVYFSNYHLGDQSYIKITSLKDNHIQILNNMALKMWYGSSAYFNGDKIKVELFVASNEKGIFCEIEKVEYDIIISKNAPGICYGVDDRVYSITSEIVGRIFPSGGTGFVLNNGKLLTAGHVLRLLDIDPTYTPIIEFNVPLSDNNGNIVRSAPEDQFVINKDYVIKEEGSIGNDWAVFYAYNSNGLTPLQKYNKSLIPYFGSVPSNTILRVSGYGVDGPPPLFGEYSSTRDEYSETFQTDTGYFAGYFGTAIKHKVTTTTGNSGSPILADGYGVIGIHTNGGCNDPNYGVNFGTAFYNNQPLYEAINKSIIKIDQIYSSGVRARGSTIKVWNDNIFNTYTLQNKPIYLLKPLNSQLVLKAEENLINNHKFNTWQSYFSLGDESIILNKFNINGWKIEIFSKLFPSNSGITIKSLSEGLDKSYLKIYFKDPWLIDYPDPQFGNTIRNQGMDAPFKQRTSPFNPNYDSSYNGDVYKGVFLNQDYRVPGLPYYSVKAEAVQLIDLPHTGRVNKFYFQNWSADPPDSALFQNANALETPVVFRNAGVTVSANYKGSLLSNSVNAFAGGSQRKIVRTENGHIHLFYISMNGLWYEKSVNNGGTFYTPKQIEYVDGATVKSFSVDYVSNRIYLVVQLSDESSSVLRLYTIDENANVTPFPDNNNYQIVLSDKSIDAMPVIGANYEDVIFIWKDNREEPLKLVRFKWNGNSWIKSNIFDIPNTGGNTINPTISLVKSQNCSKIYSHFVWEEISNSRMSELFYTRIMIVRDYINNIAFENYDGISRKSGYEVTTEPVIVETGENSAIVGFIGLRKFNDEDVTPLEKRAVLTTIPSNSRFYSFGDDVQSISLNRSNDRWVFAWSRGNDLPVQFVDSRDINVVWQLSNLRGVDVQITNGRTSTEIFAFTINTTQSPYPINFRAVYGEQIPIDRQNISIQKRRISSNGNIASMKK